MGFLFYHLLFIVFPCKIKHWPYYAGHNSNLSKRGFTMIRRISLTVFLMFLALNVKAQSTAFYDGYDEGQMFSYELWSTFYAEDCYNYMMFRNDVQLMLIDGEYSTSSNDNWNRKLFKMGGRRGCGDFVDDIETQCLDVDMCDQMGEGAAMEIIEGFCNVLQSGQVSITQECAVVATDRCKGAIYDELNFWLDYGLDCQTIGNDIGNLTFSQLRGMKDSCPAKVQELLE